MKIGLNATCFNDRPSGAKQRLVGIYGEVIRRLPDVEFVVYEPQDCRVGEWFGGAPNVSSRRTSLPSKGRARRFIGGLGYWRSALRKESFDIFEGFNLPLIRVPGTSKSVLTIHDIRGISADGGLAERVVFKAALRKSLFTADHVITVSEAMKQEILAFCPDVPISVIHNGLDPQDFDTVSVQEQNAFQQKYRLSSDFLLAVGHLEKRKNYLALLDALASLRDRGRSCSLLIIGNDSGERRAIEDRITSNGLAGKVSVLSGLSDREVRCAYKLCSLLVFPSAYEGFGIPVLEAMAANRPMVLSDIPVFREITQNQGVYFPHDDVAAMAQAIEEVLSSNDQRRRLAGYGADRLKDFNFSSLAARLEALYRSF